MKQLIQSLMADFRRLLIWFFAAATVVIVCWGSACSGDVRPGDVVNKAYQLRLDGKADEAKTMLTDYLAANPADAVGNYELARVYFYMAPGDPKNVQSAVESAEKSIQKAVELEPGNPAYRYFAARVAFLKAYIAMQSDEEHAKDHVSTVCRAFESVLESKPDYGEPMLNLIELYGGLPVELGRDSSKAAQYEDKLEAIDHVLAGKAHCIMMPDDFDRVAYWKDLAERHKGDARVLEELGKTCLREQKTEAGVEYMKEAIKTDPSKSALYLVIASHHIMKFRQDPQAKEAALPLATQAVNDFLATKPIAPLKAYALGILARLNYAQDKKSEGDKLMEEAKATDTYFSKASGIPAADLFVPPGETPHQHVYLFQPF